jgi:hypothetical protein
LGLIWMPAPIFIWALHERLPLPHCVNARDTTLATPQAG